MQLFPVPPPTEEYFHRGDIQPSHRLRAEAPWRLPLLGDCCYDLPGGIRRQRYGALVLVWRGTRWQDHRESALLTTAHSGERRISGPKTSLSLSWRKFVVSSVIFRTLKNGETRAAEKNQVGKWKNETIRILLERQKEQILADFRAEIQKNELQADSARRSIQELNGIIESQRRELDHTLAGHEQLRRDQLLLREQLSEQNRNLREAHMKSLNEMEELKRFQGSRFDELSRRRLIESQDTIHELTARIQELRNEVNCLNDSRDF